MIISYRHKFTFLHAAKTAGTSVSVYLARYLGPYDIMVGSWGDASRQGIRPNLRSYGYAWFLQSPRRTLKAYLNGGTTHALINRGQRIRFGGRLWDHSTAEEVRTFDAAAWQSNFKFTFVRSPFTRMVSIYRWSYRKGPAPPSFSEMLRRIEEDPSQAPPQWNSWRIYTVDDRIAVDFVGRQENFEADMRVIATRLGIPFRPDLLTWEKHRQGDADYASFYKPGDRQRVERLFAPEIETFGYRFPE